MTDPAFIIVGGRLPAPSLQNIVCATGLPQQTSPQRYAGQPPVVIPSKLGAIDATPIPILSLLHPKPG